MTVWSKVQFQCTYPFIVRGELPPLTTHNLKAFYESLTLSYSYLNAIIVFAIFKIVGLDMHGTFKNCFPVEQQGKEEYRDFDFSTPLLMMRISAHGKECQRWPISQPLCVRIVTYTRGGLGCGKTSRKNQFIKPLS